jgi:membrane protein
MSTTTTTSTRSYSTGGSQRSVWNLFKSTFAEWQADKAPKLGAALAFYTVFSLAPLLVIGLAIAALAFGEDAAQREFHTQLQGLLGADGAKAVESLLASARQPGAGLSAALLGVVTLFLGASGVFGELQDSLNTIWKVKPKPMGSLWRLLRSRFLSFTMVLGVAFLLLVSLVISAIMSGMVGVVGQWTGSSAILMQAANVVVSLFTITLLFALIFKLLPDTRIAWRDVWLGAVFTAALFTVGKQLIGMYLGRASISSAYGAAGSVVLVLLWAYYSAQIFFFGAEFTRAYARMYGSQAKSGSERRADDLS